MPCTSKARAASIAFAWPSAGSNDARRLVTARSICSATIWSPPMAIFPGNWIWCGPPNRSAESSYQLRGPGADALPRHGLDAAADRLLERGDLAGGPEPDFQLGAYMKYTIAGEPRSPKPCARACLQVLRRDGMIHLTRRRGGQNPLPGESQYLRNQAILGIHCTYLGESLAGIVLFRDGCQAVHRGRCGDACGDRAGVRDHAGDDGSRAECG